MGSTTPKPPEASLAVAAAIVFLTVAGCTERVITEPGLSAKGDDGVSASLADLALEGGDALADLHHVHKD